MLGVHVLFHVRFVPTDPAHEGEPRASVGYFLGARGLKLVSLDSGHGAGQDTWLQDPPAPVVGLARAFHETLRAHAPATPEEENTLDPFVFGAEDAKPLGRAAELIVGSSRHALDVSDVIDLPAPPHPLGAPEARRSYLGSMAYAASVARPEPSTLGGVKLIAFRYLVRREDGRLGLLSAYFDTNATTLALESVIADFSSAMREAPVAK